MKGLCGVVEIFLEKYWFLDSFGADLGERVGIIVI